MSHINIVFEGDMPNAKLVEVEDQDGKSIQLGEFIQRPDGLWALRLDTTNADRWAKYRLHPDWENPANLLAMPPEHVDFKFDTFVRENKI